MIIWNHITRRNILPAKINQIFWTRLWVDVVAGMEKLVDRLLITVKQVLPIARTATVNGSTAAEVVGLHAAISVLIQRMENAMGVLIVAGAGHLALAQATLQQRVNALEAALVPPQAAKLPLRVIGTATNLFASPEGSPILTNTAPLKCPMAGFSHTPPPLMSFFKVTLLAKNAISCSIMASPLSWKLTTGVHVMRIHLAVASLILILQSQEQTTQRQAHLMFVNRKTQAFATIKGDKLVRTGLGRIVQIVAILYPLTSNWTKVVDYLSALVGIILELHMLKCLVLTNFSSCYGYNLFGNVFSLKWRLQGLIRLCFGGLIYCG